MPTIMEHAKDKPVISSVAAAAVSLTAILGGAKALDIRLIPWATADEIKTLTEKMDDRDAQIMAIIKSLAAGQKNMEASQGALLREFWEKRLEEANDELKTNPGSKTAKAQKLEATRNIEMIDLNTAGVHPRQQLPAEDDEN